MRHCKRKGALGRPPAHARAMLCNQVCSLILEERIKTSVRRAKASRRLFEKLVTLAKNGGLQHRRRAIALLRPNTKTTPRLQYEDHPVSAKQAAVRKLFAEIGPRFASREGGYTRILRLGKRLGDATDLCYLEIVEETVASRNGDMPVELPPVATEPKADTKVEKAETPAEESVEEAKAVEVAVAEPDTDDTDDAKQANSGDS